MILVIVRFSSEGLDDLGENTNDLRLTCGSYECAENTNDPSARHTAWRHGVTIGMQYMQEQWEFRISIRLTPQRSDSFSSLYLSKFPKH
jgi:hypothetical protein